MCENVLPAMVRQPTEVLDNYHIDRAPLKCAPKSPVDSTWCEWLVASFETRLIQRDFESRDLGLVGVIFNFDLMMNMISAGRKPASSYS